jgi:hypothetical protein
MLRHRLESSNGESMLDIPNNNAVADDSEWEATEKTEKTEIALSVFSVGSCHLIRSAACVK